LRFQAQSALRTRTTKRRIDFNASNKKREHNQGHLVVIATLEGILSCCLPLSSRVPSTRQTSWRLD
jgi:hypothetical protein